MSLQKRLRKNSSLAIVALSLSVLSGCAARSASIPVIAASSEDPTQPFTLSIIEEVNDGERLHVAAQVKAKESWNISSVLLHLKAMKDGSTVGEAFYPLIQSMTKAEEKSNFQLKAGESRSVRISVDAQNFTDYQLDLVWGEEAEQFLDALPQSATVEIRDVALIISPQPAKPSISGSLHNKGRKPLTNLDLGIGFVWVPKGENLDLSKGFPDNESVVPVTGISIGPGASQPFSIEVEQDIAKNSEGRWEPVVRVVDRNGSADVRSESIAQDGPIAGQDTAASTE